MLISLTTNQVKIYFQLFKEFFQFNKINKFIKGMLFSKKTYEKSFTAYESISQSKV